MYVEFVGTSGAGKTILAEKVKDVFENNNSSCVTRETFFSSKKSKTYLLFWTLLNIYRLDISSAKLLLLLYYKKKLGTTRTIRAVHEHLKLHYMLSHYKLQRVIVWDGGFVQRFSNLIVMKLKDIENISNFIRKHLPSDTLLVFVDTSVENAITRRYQREIRLRSAANRTIPRRSIVQIESEKEFLEETKQAQIKTVENLMGKGVSVLRVNGSVSPEENASTIYEYIKKML